MLSEAFFPLWIERKNYRRLSIEITVVRSNSVTSAETIKKEVLRWGC